MGGLVKSVGHLFGVGNDDNNVKGTDFGNNNIDTLAGLSDPAHGGLSNVGNNQIANNSFQSAGYQNMQNMLNQGEGLQDQQQGVLNGLQNQGFNLTQGDNTLYGQEAGQIANQFGQQGNQAAQDLASRGLSSSGAAGATFQGIAGNQNQMLANAQQQIAQQRFANTQNQIAQQQNFLGQLNGQNNTAASNQANSLQNMINSNANLTLQGLTNAGQLRNQQTSEQGNFNIGAANANAQNQSQNIGDMFGGALGGAAGGAGAGAGKGAGSAIAGLFA